MSMLANAIRNLQRSVDRRVADVVPFRAIVSSVSGDQTFIQRLGTTVADAEPYAKSTADTFAPGDEVLCLPLNGKPVIIGKIRR